MATPAAHACADTHHFNQRASVTRSDFLNFFVQYRKTAQCTSRRGDKGQIEQGEKTAPVFFLSPIAAFSRLSLSLSS